MELEYKIIAYVALGLTAVYIALRLGAQWAANKLIDAEFEHVLNHENHKVKGRFG